MSKVICPTCGSLAEALVAVDKHTIPDANYDLTLRQTELRDMLITGMANKEIAERMGISTRAVQSLMRAIFRRYKCSTRTEVIATHFGLR